VLSKKERTRRAARLIRVAIDKHGELKNRKERPPLDQLVLSVFYHLTSVRRATRALSELKHAFVDWNEVRVSHPAEVAAALSSASWAREGAERVVWLLGGLYQLYNRTNLNFLSELTPTQARSCLESLPLVRRELADEVLLLSLAVDVLPCSAAVGRMCHRLGLLDNPRPTLKNQRALAKTFDRAYFPTLHMFFCDYAEDVCLPEDPLCDRCPLAALCNGGK
jgi:endonuclease-3